MALGFSKFVPYRAVCEIRYDPAYPLWDRAGHLWGSLKQIWGELAQDEIKPNSQTFRVGDQFELKVALTSASIIEHRPRTGLDEFVAAVDSFTSIVTKVLDVVTYERLGFRIFYRWECGDLQTGSEEVFKAKLITTPELPLFNVKEQPTQPELKLHWDGEKFGASIRLKVEAEKLQFLPPAVHADLLKSQTSEAVYVSYDVDYYTRAPVSIDSIRIKDFIEQSYHVVKRDSKKVLGE